MDPRAGPRRDETRGAFWVALGLALALHLALVPGLSMVLDNHPLAATARPARPLVKLNKVTGQERRIELDLQEVPAAPPPPAEPPKPPDEPEIEAPGQVVSLPPPDVEQTPDQADYAAEHAHKVERETKSRQQSNAFENPAFALQDGLSVDKPVVRSESRQSRGDGQTSAGPAGPGRADDGDRGDDASRAGGERLFALEIPRQAPRAPLQLRFDEDGIFRNRTAIPEIPGTADAPKIAMGRLADGARRSGEGGDAGEGSSRRGGGSGAAGSPSLADLTPTFSEAQRVAGAPAPDHLPDVEIDAETRLNAWRWKHAPFFNRIFDAVRRTWRVEVFREADPTGNVYGIEDRTTVVAVTIDKSGNVLEVNIAEESGVVALDTEAIRAFRAAGPFPHPPEVLFKDQERYQFTFGFHVNVEKQNLDFNWRPY